jgi:hypothetical protein
MVIQDTPASSTLNICMFFCSLCSPIFWCLQLNDLQPVARAAARIHLSGPGLKEPRLLFAHSMLTSIPRPWDNLDAMLTVPEGMMLTSLADPCMPAFERVESPQNVGYLGSKLGIYIHFPEPGTESSSSCPLMSDLCSSAQLSVWNVNDGLCRLCSLARMCCVRYYIFQLSSVCGM